MSDHDIVFDVQNVRVPKLENFNPRVLNARNFERFYRTAFKVDVNGLFQKISTSPPPHGPHSKSCSKCSVSLTGNP